MKRFKLLKEWPDSAIGDIFQWNGQGYSNQNRTALVVSKKYVEEFGYFFEEVNTVEKESDIVLEMRGSHDGIEHRDSRTHFKKKNRFDGRRLSKLEIKANLSCQEDCKDLIDILEIHKFCFPNPEPSSKKEEGWEILEGKSSNGKVHQYLKDNSHGGLSCKEIGCEIFSVLRKSDNTVFTVGDETTIGVIKRFEVSEELMYWWNEHTWYYLSQAIKAPTNTVEDKPLFDEKKLNKRLDDLKLSEAAKVVDEYISKYILPKTNNQ